MTWDSNSQHDFPGARYRGRQAPFTADAISDSPESCHSSIHINVWKKIIDFFFLIIIYLFIYLFWLCWVFVSVRGLPPVAASGGHSSSRRAGLSLSRPLLLRSTGFRRTGSAIVARGPSHSAACGTFPDQGSNPWDLPRPGLEPVSPALAGRFSTTAPPGKPGSKCFGQNCQVYLILKKHEMVYAWKIYWLT